MRLAGASLGGSERILVLRSAQASSSASARRRVRRALVAGLGQAGDVDDAWRRGNSDFALFAMCRSVAAGCLFLIEHGRVCRPAFVFLS